MWPICNANSEARRLLGSIIDSRHNHKNRNRRESVKAFISYARSLTLIKGTQFLNMFMHLMYTDSSNTRSR